MLRSCSGCRAAPGARPCSASLWSTARMWFIRTWRVRGDVVPRVTAVIQISFDHLEMFKVCDGSLFMNSEPCVFSVFAVGLRDYAWTTRYSVLYIDNPVCTHTFHSRLLGSPDCYSYRDLPWQILKSVLFSPGGNRFQLHWRRQGFCSESGRRRPGPVQVKPPPPQTGSFCNFSVVGYWLWLFLSLLLKCSNTVLPDLPRVSVQWVLCNWRGNVSFLRIASYCHLNI